MRSSLISPVTRPRSTTCKHNISPAPQVFCGAVSVSGRFFMQTIDYLQYIVEKIYSTVFATVDSAVVSRVFDISLLDF